MTDHDPLCPGRNIPRELHQCRCDLIDRVRAEERERVAEEIAQAIEVSVGDDRDYAAIARRFKEGVGDMPRSVFDAPAGTATAPLFDEDDAQ